jgi:hypothetical protein
VRNACRTALTAKEGDRDEKFRVRVTKYPTTGYRAIEEVVARREAAEVRAMDLGSTCLDPDDV